MRRDIHVPNESDGFVFTSSALRGKGISPGSQGWAMAVAACDLLPISVESEDPANVRIVVAESIDAIERDEWVGVVRGALRVPDGRLALCGGIAYVLEPATGADAYTRVVEIIPGNYRATVYCYASAPNGRRCVERSGSDEPLGAWFRRTRSSQTMPTWLHNLCVGDPSLDPGHQKQWRRAREKPGGSVIDFLLHLEAADGPLLNARITDEGVMEAGECRKPDPFPLGIPTVALEGAAENADAEPPPAKEPVKLAVAAHPGAPITIAGGPVDVPIAKLARVAQIAWMCHPYAHPSLRITFPGKPLGLGLDEVEDVTLATAGSELRIGFANSGQPADALVPLKAVAKQLSGVPDGAIVEFHSARLKTRSELGAHRYRGTVRGGTWQIEASLPPVDAACLAEAFALAEALESGRRLSARDEDEAVRIERHVTTVLADYFGSNSLQRTGTELALRRRDPMLFARVVARVFWSRYGKVWPLHDEDEAS